MNGPIYITGAGIVSAIGVGKESTLDSLVAGMSGIRRMKYLSSCHQDIPVGEVQLSNAEMASMLGIADDPAFTRTALLGRVGGMDRRELFHDQEKDCNLAHAIIATHNCGTSTELIASQFGDFALLSTISTACSSATNAIIAGADMLRCGLAETVVVGGAESLSKFHLNGFNTLMILDRRPCRPFDADRAGLNLGEGAAYLVMETAASVSRRGVRPLCSLHGYGNACDAFHQTASSPNGEGAFLAMTEALQMAGLEPADIQYVNAHGTGTPNNDLSESVALQRVFGGEIPPVSSTKSFTGHTTSASGSVEAVICILAMNRQFLPPNLNWETPMEGGIIPVTGSHSSVELRHVMSNAFGFGGNDSSIILSRYEG